MNVYFYHQSQELKMNAIANNVSEIVHESQEQLNISKEMKKMPAKYIKQSHLLFWFLNELQQKGAITPEKYTELLEYTMIFNTDVIAQVQLYEHFEQESADVAKAIKSQIRERKQSDKTIKKTMTQDGVGAKRGRKKTPVRVVSDNQNDLIADLVKLANEDVDVATNVECPKPKHKYVRKNPTHLSIAPIEADVADVKPKRKYVRKSPVSSPKTSQPIEVAAETVIVTEPITPITTDPSHIISTPEVIVAEKVNNPKRKYVRKSPVNSPKTMDISTAGISILPEEPVVVPITEVAPVVKEEETHVANNTTSNVSELNMESFENEDPPREEGEILDDDVECETLVLSQFISNGRVSHLIDPVTNELYDLEGNELVGIYDPITKTIKDISNE